MCIYKQWPPQEPRHFCYRVCIWRAVCRKYSFGKYLVKEYSSLYCEIISLFWTYTSSTYIILSLVAVTENNFSEEPSDRFFSPI